MEAGVVGREVVGALEARAVLELYVRELGGDLDHLVHVAIGGAENDLAALLGEVAQHRDGRCVFSDVLDVHRLDLVAERGFDGFAALVVGPGPTVVADRAEEGEADLDLFLGEGLAADQRQCSCRGTSRGDEAAAIEICHVNVSCFPFLAL